MTYKKASIRQATRLYRSLKDDLDTGAVAADMEPAVRKNVATIGNLLVVVHRQNKRLARLHEIANRFYLLRDTSQNILQLTVTQRELIGKLEDRLRNATRDFELQRDENTMLRDIIEAHGLDVDVLIRDHVGDDGEPENVEADDDDAALEALIMGNGE